MSSAEFCFKPNVSPNLSAKKQLVFEHAGEPLGGSELTMLISESESDNDESGWRRVTVHDTGLTADLGRCRIRSAVCYGFVRWGFDRGEDRTVLSGYRSFAESWS